MTAFQGAVLPRTPGGHIDAASHGLEKGRRSCKYAVRLLQVFAFSIMVFPSTYVFKPIGAGGYPAAIIAYVLFFGYIFMMLFGRHDPFAHRSPVRIALCILWLAALASYALKNPALLSGAQLSSADRWLIQLVALSGVILVASEYLRSLEDVHSLLRALTLGGTVSAVVAVMQFWLRLDIAPHLGRILPGFALNQDLGAGITVRAGLNRVAGTATSPIEMGVVAGILLPLAIYLAMHDTKRSAIARWLPVLCLAVTVPVTISRSGTISAALALAVFIIALAPARRLNVMAAIPVVLCGVSVAARRLLGTIAEYFSLGTSDNSISHRVNNYPYAVHLISQAPWFGAGGGTYIAPIAANLGEAHILDDQYLDAGIELGLVGLVLLTFFLFWPVMTAFAACARACDPRLRELSGALGGGALASLICSATFDSFAFPMFIMVEALVIGLTGAVWLLVKRGPQDIQLSPQEILRLEG